jgi:hypothetical protein
VRLIQPVRVGLIQVTTNYISFWHKNIMVCLDSDRTAMALSIAEHLGFGRKVRLRVDYSRLGESKLAIMRLRTL